MIRNLENEKPGTRYGKRVVVRPEAIIYGGSKHPGLWMRCDCGKEDLVTKSAVVNGRAKQCVECKANEKSARMTSVWAERKRHQRLKTQPAAAS